MTTAGPTPGAEAAWPRGSAPARPLQAVGSLPTRLPACPHSSQPHADQRSSLWSSKLHEFTAFTLRESQVFHF